MMDLDENDGKFEIEEKNESKIKLGNEIGSPPIIIVVQGGKNVSKNKLLFKLSLENLH